MELKIPEALRKEHEELHSQLAEATRASGKIGEAAKAVAKLLHPHFVKEEEYALPPLGLLSVIAAGQILSDTERVLRMTDRLKAELHEMLEEHKTIVSALENLAAVAKEEKRTEYVQFVEKLMHHAKTEEEVLYPAAILIGEYLELKVKK